MVGEATTMEDTLVNLLRQVKEVLDKHGIEFWLECGTLLGAVREGKIIPWDDDLDLSSWDSAFNDGVKMSIAREFHQRGFRVMLYQDLIRVITTETLADVYLYRQYGDSARHDLPSDRLLDRLLRQCLCLLAAPDYYGVPVTGPTISRLRARAAVTAARMIPSFLRKRIASVMARVHQKTRHLDARWEVPARYLRDLSTIQFYGMEFRVPARVEEYLAYRYGEDWRTPSRSYVSLRDDGTLRRSDA